MSGSSSRGCRRALEAYLRKLPAETRRSPLAEAARVLAAKLDDPEAAAYAVAQASREFRELLAELGKHAPAKTNDGIDDITAARARRRGTAA